MRLFRSFFRISLATIFWFIVISVLWVGLLGLANPPVTWIMVEQSNEQGQISRTTVGLEEIARNLPLSVIASEDQRFMTHNGFSWDAMRKAMEKNKKGKRIKGGSTISQQTAKNVFLVARPKLCAEGTGGLVHAAHRTSGPRSGSFEVYLNVAEMGKGVFGAEAAAQHCFSRPASSLHRHQAALITATLPSPRRFSCTNPSGDIRGRQQWVLRQMDNVGDVLDPEVGAPKGATNARNSADREREVRTQANQAPSRKFHAPISRVISPLSTSDAPLGGW